MPRGCLTVDVKFVTLLVKLKVNCLKNSIIKPKFSYRIELCAEQ